MSAALVAFGDIPRIYAESMPDTVAISYPDATFTWSQLVPAVASRARLFRELGVKAGDFVTLAAPNCAMYHVNVLAAFKLGATPNNVSHKAPAFELRQIVELAKPSLVIGPAPDLLPGFRCVAPDADTSAFDASDFPATIGPYWKAATSGGSTGRSKIIVDHKASGIANLPDWASIVPPGYRMLNPGPLYHNAPFTGTHSCLIRGGSVYGMTHFDAEEALRLIERHRLQWVNLVPTMMGRIWALPEEVRNRYDLSSLEQVWHMASFMPAWLKWKWIGWLGASRIFELYGGTELGGSTVITGDEWVKKPGSVGKAVEGQGVRVLRDDKTPCVPGEIGDVYLRVADGAMRAYHYLGAETKLIEGGWESLGDLGHVDEDGYLFLADRRTDLILRGGANVYPAEVEAALDAFPEVASSIVVGLPDADLGWRVHAIVQPRSGNSSLDLAALHTFLLGRLAKDKVPESYELVAGALRDDAGKARRSALRDERAAWVKEGREFRVMAKGLDH